MTPPDAAGDWSERRAVDDGGRRDPARRVPLGGLHRSGGELKMIQLWVNLPAKDKMATPATRALPLGRSPPWRWRTAPDRFGLLPASMTTSAARPIPSHRLTWDLQLNQGTTSRCANRRAGVPRWWCWKGVIINGSESAREGQLAVLSRQVTQCIWRRPPRQKFC